MLTEGAMIADASYIDKLRYFYLLRLVCKSVLG